MPFLVLKAGPFFFCFFCFFVFENLILPAERRGLKKKKKKNKPKKTTFLALKTGPILLRNILGPVFNASLDQFLTLGFLFFLCFFSFFWAETPIFIVFSAKNAKFKETQKRKKDTICEHTCANCSCQNVLFLCIFHFWGFCNFQFFQRCFLIGSQNSKNYKI